MIITSLLKKWILSLLTEDKLPSELFISESFLEDGMNTQQYWDYEKSHFKNLAPLYDLTTEFSIKILGKYQLSANKTMYFFYLYNHLGKVVYKMNQTISIIEDKPFFSGNGFYCQLVPKFTIFEGKITGLGLAIQTPLILDNIICPTLETRHFYKGANYQEDDFYSAAFICEEDVQNSWQKFYLYLKKDNEVIIEKHQIYFDNFDPTLFPIEKKENLYQIINHTYPVNLALFKNDNIENISYPRSIKFDVDQYDKIIVTDCLDNDWHLFPPYLTLK